MISGFQCIIFGMEKCVEFLLPCGIINEVEYLKSYWLILLFCYIFVLYAVLGSLSGWLWKVWVRRWWNSSAQKK